MRKYLVVLFFLIRISLYAETLSLNIEARSTSVLVGLPIEISASLHGPGKFTLPEAFSLYCNEYGSIGVADLSGNRADWSYGPCPMVTKSPFDSASATKYDKVATAPVVLWMRPGTYSIEAVYHSSGPFTDRYSDTDMRPVQGIWEGLVYSNSITVTVAEPIGEDQRCMISLMKANALASDYVNFLELHHLEILRDFPLSTYAAKIIVSALPEVENTEPAKLKKIMDTTPFIFSGVKPDGQSPTGFREIPNGRLAAQWQIDNAKKILKTHPEFYADRLNLVVGISKLFLGKREEALTSLRDVARKENSKEGKWARDFIALLQ